MSSAKSDKTRKPARVRQNRQTGAGFVALVLRRLRRAALEALQDRDDDGRDMAHVAAVADEGARAAEVAQRAPVALGLGQRLVQADEQRAQRHALTPRERDELGGERLGAAQKLCLILAAATLVALLPVNYLWWRLLGWW